MADLKLLGEVDSKIEGRRSISPIESRKLRAKICSIFAKEVEEDKKEMESKLMNERALTGTGFVAAAIAEADSKHRETRVSEVTSNGLSAQGGLKESTSEQVRVVDSVPNVVMGSLGVPDTTQEDDVDGDESEDNEENLKLEMKISSQRIKSLNAGLESVRLERDLAQPVPLERRARRLMDRG
ncbi:hypothetical protein U1Q18_031765 [Sarracenia purpurea var. burkii]